MQHDKRQRNHDDKRRRIDEPVSPETRNDEVAVDVPLSEKTAEMSSENCQGWITEEAAERGGRVADPAQEPSSQGTISGRNGPSSSALAG